MLTLAVILAAVAAAGTLGLAALFAVNPAAGLARAGHEAARLPEVMANRYLAFALFAAAAALSGDPAVLAVTFAILAVPALGDILIYARAGQRPARLAGHILAAGGALAVCGLALLAMR